MITVNKDTIIKGPNNQAYRVLRDIHMYDLFKAEDFEAINGAPIPLAGAKAPKWLVDYVKGINR